MGKRVVTFRSVDESGFRLVTPQGNRDFEMGILSTDEDDPALGWLLVWGKANAKISITDTEGEADKAGVKVCPVCGQQVGGDVELAEHNEAVHVQPESKGVKKPYTRRKKG